MGISLGNSPMGQSRGTEEFFMGSLKGNVEFNGKQ